MKQFIEKIKLEISKDKNLIDTKRCLNLLEDISHLNRMNNGFEDQINDLENQVEDLEDQLDKLKKELNTIKIFNGKTLDDNFKNEIFQKLSSKYTSWQLEDILKNNNIM